jgi:RNA polymerase sigma-70 factor, ECF subfamily
LEAGRETSWDWAGVHAVCLRETRRYLRGADAEDAAQEAVLRAWRKQWDCRLERAPAAWVRQIARNEALRAAGRARDRLDSPAGDPLDLPSPTEDRSMQSIPKLDVRAAIASLSRTDQQIAALRYLADLPNSQIAEILNLPEATARVRLHRLRSKLRASLETYSE